MLQTTPSHGPQSSSLQQSSGQLAGSSPHPSPLCVCAKDSLGLAEGPQISSPWQGVTSKAHQGEVSSGPAPEAGRSSNFLSENPEVTGDQAVICIKSALTPSTSVNFGLEVKPAAI